MRQTSSSSSCGSPVKGLSIGALDHHASRQNNLQAQSTQTSSISWPCHKMISLKSAVSWEQPWRLHHGRHQGQALMKRWWSRCRPVRLPSQETMISNHQLIYDQVQKHKEMWMSRTPAKSQWCQMIWQKQPFMDTWGCSSICWMVKVPQDWIWEQLNQWHGISRKATFSIWR